MVFSQCANAVAENFFPSNTENFNNTNGNKELKMLFVVVVWLVAILFVGMWLWNNVLVKVCSVAKPMTNIWQILGLAFLLDLLIPKCC